MPAAAKLDLRDLCGVGLSIERDLKKIGVTTVADLALQDGQELYARLCQFTGSRQDPCVLDTFRCAVAQARDPHLPVEQRNWWWWSRRRKEGRL
ncbi:MAG: helix-hairpin-helix domain-containing protein [Acidobacteriota bacterium]|nr:helix-hairpin-helix domain-containing protein [Acidobacteriota bacterium]